MLAVHTQAAQSFNVNLGDLPTWLAVIFAAIAAVVAFRQSAHGFS